MTFLAISDVAVRLLGKPNPRHSSASDWRYGKHGSLSVDPARDVWHDHEAGVGGGVVALAMRVRRCDRAAALDWMRREGVVATSDVRTLAPRAVVKPSTPHEVALALWEAASDPYGTLAERYLASRRLSLPMDASDVLRFHPACPFGEGVRLPCMVALYRDVLTDARRAIHRTALAPDASKIGRKMLGANGGAAIKLHWEPGRALGVCEGIETGLAVMHAGWRAVWALGSAGAFASMPVLPYAELSIFADPGAAGEAAATNLAVRWSASGQWAHVHIPNGDGDFADILAGAGHE